MINFVGHAKQVDILTRQVERNRVAHGYLFYGIRGLGKTQVAQWFAQALVCSRPVGGRPCTTCISCEAHEQGRHPDVITLLDGEKQIYIETIRELRERLTLQPVLAKRQVVLMEDAAACNMQSWNALLKTLEEPRGATVFIFVTHAIDRIPATIRSRLALVAFAPLSLSDLNAVKTGNAVSPEDFVAAAGRPAYFSWLTNTPTDATVIALMQACEKEERAEQIVRIKAFCQRQRSELHAQLVTPTQEVSPVATARRIKRLYEAERLLEKHITPSLIIRFLWFAF